MKGHWAKEFVRRALGHDGRIEVSGFAPLEVLDLRILRHIVAMASGPADSEGFIPLLRSVPQNRSLAAIERLAGTWISLASPLGQNRWRREGFHIFESSLSTKSGLVFVAFSPTAVRLLGLDPDGQTLRIDLATSGIRKVKADGQEMHAAQRNLREESLAFANWAIGQLQNPA